MKKDDSFDKFMSGESIFGNDYNSGNAADKENSYDRNNVNESGSSIADEYAEMFGQKKEENTVQPPAQYNQVWTNPSQNNIGSGQPMYGNMNVQNTNISSPGGLPQSDNAEGGIKGSALPYVSENSVVRSRGVFPCITLIIVGFILTAIIVLIFLFSVYSANKTREFFENAEEYSGIITDTVSHTKTDEDSTETYYNVQVTYVYDSMTYSVWSEDLDESDFYKLTGSADEIGKPINIYVDTREPQTMRLKYDPDPQPAYFVLIFVIIGLIPIVLGINLLIRFNREYQKNRR